MAMSNYDYVKDATLAGLKEKVNAAYASGRYPFGGLQFLAGGFIQILTDSGDSSSYDYVVASSIEDLQAKVDEALVSDMYPYGPVYYYGPQLVQLMLNIETSASGGSGGAPYRVTGRPQVGETLTAVISPGYVNTGGNWTRNGTNISGATGLTYVVQSADAQNVVTYKSANITFYIPPGLLIEAEATPPVLEILGTPRTTGQNGTIWPGFTVSTTGGSGTKTFSVASGPTGLVVNSTTGVVTWPNVGAGTAPTTQQAVTIRATDQTSPIPQTADLSFNVTIQAAPAISAQPQSVSINEGETATFSVTMTNVASRQWQVAPASGSFTDVAGATGTSYTSGALNNASHNGRRYRVVGKNSSGAVIITSDEAVVTVSAPSDYRPIFFVGPASAHTTNTTALIAAGTRMANGSNGSKVVSSFPVQTTPGNYGWVALPAAASSAGATFTDLVANFAGDWNGAGFAGDREETGPVPATSSTVVTYDGNSYRLFRMEWMNSSPSAKNWSIA